MMFRTHMAVSAFLILLFLPVVVHIWSFVIILLIAGLMPDVDMSQSFLGKYRILRPLQWFVKHRGFFHSLTFALIFTLIFMFYIPIIALPFFLGYTGHLLADSLTSEGIRPFWPSKDEMRWKIKTNGKTEQIIFYVLCFVNLLLLVRLFV